ncbi:hypothetical protein [Flavihumibacter sp. UBA7668]|uniref:hypothetical protein n=1 Tax=Flavihumibacter sp. UBA7668 TaxID=1946542 RepID=UPI0025C233A8|nr:hypothetical protein [Flavihumibacter sp. UBA7668]
MQVPEPNFSPNLIMEELEAAIVQAPIKRLLKATHVIASLRERKKYLELFRPFLNQNSIPGKHFADLGNSLRTTACTENVESREWEKIDLNKSVYNSILHAHLENAAELLSEKEIKLLRCSGLLLTYLQTIHFTTDYLNKDIYYKTKDTDHNLHRAFNQLILLEKMEAVQPLPHDWK